MIFKQFPFQLLTILLKRLEKPGGYTPSCDVLWGFSESCLGTIRPMFAKYGTSMTCSILIYEFNGYLANLVTILHPWLEPIIDARL